MWRCVIRWVPSVVFPVPGYKQRRQRGTPTTYHTQTDRAGITVRVADRQRRIQDQGDQRGDRCLHSSGIRNASQLDRTRRHHFRNRGSHYSVYLSHLQCHARGEIYLTWLCKKSSPGIFTNVPYSFTFQSPPKGATIPYRPKPQVGGPVILAGGQAYTIQGNYAVPAHTDVSTTTTHHHLHQQHQQAAMPPGALLTAAPAPHPLLAPPGAAPLLPPGHPLAAVAASVAAAAAAATAPHAVAAVSLHHHHHQHQDPLLKGNGHLQAALPPAHLLPDVSWSYWCSPPAKPQTDRASVRRPVVCKPSPCFSPSIGREGPFGLPPVSFVWDNIGVWHKTNVNLAIKGTIYIVSCQWLNERTPCFRRSDFNLHDVLLIYCQCSHITTPIFSMICYQHYNVHNSDKFAK